MSLADLMAVDRFVHLAERARPDLVAQIDGKGRHGFIDELVECVIQIADQRGVQLDREDVATRIRQRFS